MEITGKEFAKQFAKYHGCPQYEAKRIVDDFLHLIEYNYENGVETSFYGFGKFGIAYYNDCLVPDKENGGMRRVPGHYYPRFVPGQRTMVATKKWAFFQKLGET